MEFIELLEARIYFFLNYSQHVPNSFLPQNSIAQIIFCNLLAQFQQTLLKLLA